MRALGADTTVEWRGGTGAKGNDGVVCELRNRDS
jgi:hypothetical protein